MGGSLKNAEAPAQPAAAEQEQQAQHAAPHRSQQLSARAIRQGAEKEIHNQGITPVIQIEHIGCAKMQRVLRAQKKGKREIVEVVVHRRPEARHNKIVRRHVMQESLQQRHVVEMIVPGRSVENELAI